MSNTYFFAKDFYGRPLFIKQVNGHHHILGEQTKLKKPNFISLIDQKLNFRQSYSFFICQ